MIDNYIWVIDDDAIYTFTIKKLLQKGQLADKIDVFSNGQSAIDRLNKISLESKNYPDIILLDISMPVFDGWQFMDEFVKFVDKAAITVYMVSSSIDPRDKERALQYKEIKNYVIKPITLESLRELVEVKV